MRIPANARDVSRGPLVAPGVLSSKSRCAQRGRQRTQRKDARHDSEDDTANLVGVLRDGDEQREFQQHARRGA